MTMNLFVFCKLNVNLLVNDTDAHMNKCVGKQTKQYKCIYAYFYAQPV